MVGTVSAATSLRPAPVNQGLVQMKEAAPMTNSPVNSASESLPTSGLQLQSLLTSSGNLELTLEPTDIRPPGANEVVVRVEAAPVNPSDLGLLLGAADVSTAKTGGEGSAPQTR